MTPWAAWLGGPYRRGIARPLRIIDPAGFYHVGSAGNNKEPLFFDDLDMMDFLARLARVAIQFRWLGLAFVLMRNHVHYVMRVPHGGLSAGMQLLNTGYSIRTGRRHGRSGHLFRNRFYSGTLESEAHLMEACRYVVLNPVRAGLCDRPEKWPWSSYRASAGIELGHPFLRTDELLRLFGPDPESARLAYRTFVADGHVRVSDTRVSSRDEARGAASRER